MNYFKALIIVFISAICCTWRCNGGKELEVEINPHFEKNPPIARSISAEVLERPTQNGENIRFMAEFSKEDLDNKMFVIRINNKKLILRDDGRGADRQKDDGLFSVYLKENIDSLNNELIKRKNLFIEQGSFTSFSNRSIDRIHKPDSSVLNFERLEPGVIAEVPLEVFKVYPFPSANFERKSLMITDLSVVEDPERTYNPCTGAGNPDGPWTFGTLMRELASPSPSNIADDATVSQFVLDWLETWENQLSPRTKIRTLIIDPWLINSQNEGAPAGQLKMKFAPFKLAAIVNRLDLRGNGGYGFSNAGEGRFVFTAQELDIEHDVCRPLRFNVIFEYGINIKGCSAIKTYAQQWVNLDALPINSVQYRTALQNITDQFTKSGSNPTKFNQSSLNQIRTNEVALAEPWELREFNLGPFGLKITTVKQEPAEKFNAKNNTPNVQQLASYVNNNALDIIASRHEVPLIYNGSNFLGTKAHTIFPPIGSVDKPNNNPHHWDGADNLGPAYISSDEARHMFSLNTCSGCHGGETQTFFTHIHPTGFGQEAPLSGFLTGTPPIGGGNDFDMDPNNGIMTVNDPAGRPSLAPPKQRGFNDLLRRKNDINALVNNTCGFSDMVELAHYLIFDTVRMTH